MKHTVKATFMILCIFFISQLIGLFIVNNYIDYAQLKEGKISFNQLPLNIERPQLEEKTSFVYLVIALLIGTAIALVLIRFRQLLLWKLWFLLAIFITLNVSFNAFVPATVALFLATIFSLWKILRPNFYIQNFTELFVYGGLAAILVPVLNVFSVSMLLILISIYDAYAVWKSKHMIELAGFMTKSKLFAGVIVPYQLPKSSSKKGPKVPVKVKTAILGGGDIGFPLLFAGVLFKQLVLTNSISIAFMKVLFVPILATIALGWLLYKAEKDRFYPAMPFISLGCFLALALMKLAGFL